MTRSSIITIGNSTANIINDIITNIDHKNR